MPAAARELGAAPAGALARAAAEEPPPDAEPPAAWARRVRGAARGGKALAATASVPAVIPAAADAPGPVPDVTAASAAPGIRAEVASVAAGDLGAGRAPGEPTRAADGSGSGASADAIEPGQRDQATAVERRSWTWRWARRWSVGLRAWTWRWAKRRGGRGGEALDAGRSAGRRPEEVDRRSRAAADAEVAPAGTAVATSARTPDPSPPDALPRWHGDARAASPAGSRRSHQAPTGNPRMGAQQASHPGWRGPRRSPRCAAIPRAPAPQPTRKPPSLGTHAIERHASTNRAARAESTAVVAPVRRRALRARRATRTRRRLALRRRSTPPRRTSAGRWLGRNPRNTKVCGFSGADPRLTAAGVVSRHGTNEHRRQPRPGIRENLAELPAGRTAASRRRRLGPGRRSAVGLRAGGSAAVAGLAGAAIGAGRAPRHGRIAASRRSRCGERRRAGGSPDAAGGSVSAGAGRVR